MFFSPLYTLALNINEDSCSGSSEHVHHGVRKEAQTGFRDTGVLHTADGLTLAYHWSPYTAINSRLKAVYCTHIQQECQSTPNIGLPRVKIYFHDIAMRT